MVSHLYRAGSQRLGVDTCSGSPWPEWSQLWNGLGDRWSQSYDPPGRSADKSSKMTTQSNGSLLRAKEDRRRKKPHHWSITMSDFPFSVFYIQLANTISGITLLAPLLAPGTFKTDRKQLQHTSEANNVPNAKTNYSDSPVGIQK